MKTTTRMRRATRIQKAPTNATRTRRKVTEKGGRSPAADGVTSSDHSTIEIVDPVMEVDKPFRRITRAAARAAKQAGSPEPIKEEAPRVDKGKGKAKESAEVEAESKGSKRKWRGRVVDDGSQNEQDVAQTHSTRRTRRKVETTTEALCTGGEALAPLPQPLVQAGVRGALYNGIFESNDLSEQLASETSVEKATQTVDESTIEDVPHPGPMPSSSRVTLDQTEHHPTLRSQDTSNTDTVFAHAARPAPPQVSSEPARLPNNPPAMQDGAEPANGARSPGINRIIRRQRPIRPLPVRAPRQQAALERARRIFRRFDLLKNLPLFLVNFDFGW